MKHILLLLTLLIAGQAGAQTGIGTTTPSPSSILELKSSNKGLLIPRSDSATIWQITSPANGLMVYDTVRTVLYVYNTTGGWKRIRPVESLNTLVAGTANGDVLVWNGSSWQVTPKCSLFTYFYRDKDGDGYGDPYFPVMGCVAPLGFVSNNTDCDDNAAARHPGATEICNGLDDDCNGLTDDGVNTSTDPNNCGTCGHVCALPNAVTGCSGGVCFIISCNTGFKDCNGMSSDGCEINIMNDPNNCSACGVVCNLPNAISGCSGGACAIISCNPGFANCDGITANGCEVHVTNDPNNCGSCGHICSLPNAVSNCSGSGCVIASCNTGFADCDGNPANGCEVNLATSISNCGGCGNACILPNATTACNAGSCQIAGCATGFFNADGNTANGCELSAPVLLGSTTSNISSPTAIAVAGNFAYVTNASSLAIYDISAPASPLFKSSIITGINSPKGVAVSGNFAFVINAGSNMLSAYDISNPSSIVASGAIGTNINGPRSIFVSGNFAYVANGTGNSLSIYNISNPASITFTGITTSNLTNPSSVVVSGTTAFVTSQGTTSLCAYNVATPSSPAFSSSTTTGLSGPVNLTVSGTIAYVLSPSINRLSLFDVSNPLSMAARGATTSLNAPVAVGVSVPGAVATVLNGGAPQLSTFNVSNVNSIVNRSFTTGSLSSPVAMAVSGGNAYIVQNNTLQIYSLP